MPTIHKAPVPRIRAVTGAPARARAPAPPSPRTVFRDFVATLEKLEAGRRRKPAPPAGKDGSAGDRNA